MPGGNSASSAQVSSSQLPPFPEMGEAPAVEAEDVIMQDVAQNLLAQQRRRRGLAPSAMNGLAQSRFAPGNQAAGQPEQTAPRRSRLDVLLERRNANLPQHASRAAYHEERRRILLRGGRYARDEEVLLGPQSRRASRLIPSPVVTYNSTAPGNILLDHRKVTIDSTVTEPAALSSTLSNPATTATTNRIRPRQESTFSLHADDDSGSSESSRRSRSLADANSNSDPRSRRSLFPANSDTRDECVTPWAPSGDIPGCYRCNSLTHTIDTCRVRPPLDLEARYAKEVQGRVGRPPLRSTLGWNQLALEMNHEGPGPISRMMMGRLSSRYFQDWNYLLTDEQQFHLLVADPATINLERIRTLPDQGYEPPTGRPRDMRGRN
ncbi:hypothetical protein F4677DRAFT_460060 [Hypoxylon crocopeplum]|nr:hypothetical protein F4677DRAFT_460060 [Hypoxylon crocopeplum]